MPGITYETVFIAEPDIPTERVDQIIAKIKETIAVHKGSVTSEDRWGRRRLAYPLRGHREGFYAVMNFTAEPTVIAALEHLYNVTDAVIRQLTVKQIKSKKKFRPRRERAPGEVHRGPARGGGGGRPSGPRGDAPHRPATPAPSAAAPAATPAPTETASPDALGGSAQGEKP